MHNSGIQGKNLRIMRKLYENLTANIETKHGNTRAIQIRDSIRQGGVPSVAVYANLMDEIAKELEKDERNYITIGNEKTNRMDDVVLMHTEKTQMQNMLDTTHEIASRYRL